MSALTADSITVLRAAYVVDKYGNPSSVRDWAHAVATPAVNVSVQPNASAEATGDRNTVSTGWRLFTRRGHDLDLLATDRVLFDGMTLEVDGEIGRWRLAGRVHHIEASLKRVTNG